jgi:hypothetical protein
MIIIAALFIFIIVLCMIKLMLSLNANLIYLNTSLIFNRGYDKNKDP